jgi:4'-phosphopantetheinyl transferase
MLHIYVAHCKANCYQEVIRDYLHYLPTRIINKARLFRLEIDSCRYLLGKILLARGLEMMGYTNVSLDDVRVSSFNKPYFSDSIYFNISHSGNYVVCGVSTEYELGIDLEEMRSIDIHDFKQGFTDREWDYIINSPDPVPTFYQLWTKKEAVIKADGRGLHISLLSFDVINEPVMLDSKQWSTKSLFIADGYATHVATSEDIRNNYLIRQII